MISPQVAVLLGGQATISPVIAALLGALLGAVATQTLREFLDYRQRKNELKGLLRLLDIETQRNRRQLEAFRDTPDWITNAPTKGIRFTEWDASKSRIAILLNDDTKFADIAKYYENMREVNDFRTSARGSSSRVKERVKKQLSILFELQDLVSKHIRSHVADSVKGTPLESLRRDPGDPQEAERPPE